MRKFLSLIIIGAMVFGAAGCSAKETAPVTEDTKETTTATTTATTAVSEADLTDNSDDIFVSAYSGFKVTSESLHDGKWDEICSKTSEGENASPQLSWNPVEGAATYVIYMVDMNASNFLHWKSAGITETTLPQGWASVVEYAGPYPPSGTTHRYNVYVFALKAPVEKARGAVNGPVYNLKEFMDELDTDAEGNTGNVISVGRISGTYTSK